MDADRSRQDAHQKGEQKELSTQDYFSNIDEINKVKLDTYNGVIHLEWEPNEPLTPIGQLPFFIDFLKTIGLYEDWVLDCPLNRQEIGENVSPIRTHNILGTFFLSILSGQNRYAHITSVRNDIVNPPLLGMKKIVSEDTARRSFKYKSRHKENSKKWFEGKNQWRNECDRWMKKHIKKCYYELTCEPWILDVDTTVKVLYGHQEGAEIGYNPQKPGRPSHIIHTYMFGETRLILDAEVKPGNQTPSKYTLPGLLEIVDSLPYDRKPTLIRGDCAFGNELVLSSMEKRGLNYLFKIKKTKNVKVLIDFLSGFSSSEWKDAGQGWYGIASELILEGWTKTRGVIVLRRIIKRGRGKPKKSDQLLFPFMNDDGSPCIECLDKKYEYAVLITNLKLSIPTISQLYRDRAGCENIFDELKNQWGWGGYVTKDILRTQITARITALVFNWWTLFCRLSNPKKHSEAITSKPLLLYSTGKRIEHARKTTIVVTPSHAKHKQAEKSLKIISKITSLFRSFSEHIDIKTKLMLMLSFIFSDFLQGRILGSIKNIPNWYHALC